MQDILNYRRSEYLTHYIIFKEIAKGDICKYTFFKHISYIAFCSESCLILFSKFNKFQKEISANKNFWK